VYLSPDPRRPAFVEAEVATGGQEPGSQSLAKRISEGCGPVFLAVRQKCP
jgi:hypothetical protein